MNQLAPKGPASKSRADAQYQSSSVWINEFKIEVIYLSISVSLIPTMHNEEVLEMLLFLCLVNAAIAVVDAQMIDGCFPELPASLTGNYSGLDCCVARNTFVPRDISLYFNSFA